jgi:hypothetical protein
MERGVLVQGRLTDKVTGKPVSGRLFYVPRPENPHLKNYPKFSAVSVNAAETEKDGSFTVVVVPGPGLLCAKAREDRYVRAEVKGLGAKPPILLTISSFHAIVPIDPSEKERKSLTCDIALDPGRTLNGCVLGPDGKPLDGVFAAGLTAAYSATDGSPAKPRLTGGAFTVVGLIPGRPRTLVFWHEEKKLAQTVLVRGEEPGPLTIRLAPLGAVTGRLVDASGRPQVGASVQAPYSSRQKETLPAELAPPYPDVIPPVLPLGEATTDGDGRFRLQGLLPGMKYDLVAVKDGESLGKLVEDVRFPSGETKDLGDIKPQAKQKRAAKEQPR